MNHGYTEEWVKLGIIHYDEIETQVNEAIRLKDNNTEHMRYKSLLRFYESSKLSISVMPLLFDLLDQDTDQIMIIGFYLKVINDPRIDSQMFEIISEKLLSIDSRYKQDIERAAIKREYFMTGSLSEKTIMKFIAIEKYHRILVDHCSCPKLLNKIQKISNSKKINNIINAKLQFG